MVTSAVRESDATGAVGRAEVERWVPPALADAGERPPPGHRFDLVIRGGRVIDPASGLDGLLNVGIDGATVTELSVDPLEGEVEWDASGRVVAPGFIDLLSYEPNEVGAWLKLADGVTTNLAMHGVSNYADAFFRRHDGRSPIHFGGAFHHHFMRGFDLGVDIGVAADRNQRTALANLLRRGLDNGFAGVAFSPEYSPGTSTREMMGLAEVAAERGHVAFFHVRHSDPFPPGTGLDAIDEVLAIARWTGVSVHLQHLTSTGGTHQMAAAIDRIERARSEGLDVTACVYPYDFWGTFLASSRFAPGWQRRYDLTVADLQIAGTSTRLTAADFGTAVADNKLVAAIGSIPEADVRLALAQPWMIVSSDAIPTPGANNHPRGAGTFARTIGRYARRAGVLSLREALAKVTILPARRTEAMLPAMARKGRLQRGADADIVVFDPETIIDRATVEHPDRASSGIDLVVVAGQVALRSGRPDRSVRAGQPLRSTSPGN